MSSMQAPDQAQTCRRCGSTKLERHRIVPGAGRAPVLDVLACECGDYWVEGDGRELTPEMLRALGLLP
jgi:hypothetical protein